MVCAFSDIKVLDAKGNYAFPIALSPFKRHGGLKILLLIKIKSKKINIRKFVEIKKNSDICSVIKKKEINMKTIYIITISNKETKEKSTFVKQGSFNDAIKYAKLLLKKGEYIKSISEA